MLRDYYLARRGRAFAVPTAAAGREAPRGEAECCELCSERLAPEHQHLFDPSQRRLLCACDACALLFDSQATAKYRRVPRRVRRLADDALTDEQFAALSIPIGLAFVFHSDAIGGPVAVYPSPAGPTEVPLDAAWHDLVRENPALREIEPDVEALLVNRVADRRQCYLVPIDQCYKLVGLVRLHWQGFSGGDRFWQEMERFFADLQRRSGS